MLDPSSAAAAAASTARRPRSRSASMVSLRLPHITVQVEDGTRITTTHGHAHESSLDEQARDQRLDLSPTRSLPTPTIHIMNDFSTSTYTAPCPPSRPHLDMPSDGTRHHRNGDTASKLETPSMSSMNLEPAPALHKRSSFLHDNHSGAGISGGRAKRHSKREERMRTLSTASAVFRQPSSQMQGIYHEEQYHADHRFPTIRQQTSQAFSAKSAAPLNFHDLSAIYMVVASRRDSYDNLLWQCPTLALTAQSFLFSIALDGETTRVARIIAMLLSIVITTCSLQLFTRQLAAEQADRQWLISFERRHGVPFEDTAFGENWDRYSAELPQSAGFVKVLALTGSFPLWRNSLFIFLGAAITVLAISFIKPSLFEGGDSRRGVGG